MCIGAVFKHDAMHVHSDVQPRQKRCLPRKKAAFTYEKCFSMQQTRSTIRTARFYGEMSAHAALAQPEHINNL
ncbi:MAG: hypothetical protein OEY03_05470, partial [Rhizobacter sp.]|nr:hypothetical protein [Rhizobacter sp.]